MAALDLPLLLERHVVAQVVEPELVVRAVGDVGEVGLALGRLGLSGEHDVHGQPEEAVDPSHPVGVALGQVLVDRDDVHAPAREGVEVHRHRRGERLALTGLHLRDVAVVQRGTAEHLDVVRTLQQHPPRRFARDRERLRLDVIQGLPVVEPLPELVGLGLEFLVGESFHLLGPGVDRLDDLLQLLRALVLPRTEDLVYELWHGEPSPRRPLVSPSPRAHMDADGTPP